MIGPRRAPPGRRRERFAAYPGERSERPFRSLEQTRARFRFAPVGDRAPAPTPGRSDRQRVEDLLDAEKDFGAALTDEIDAVHHQERTRAILGHNAEASASRAGLLRDLLAALSR